MNCPDCGCRVVNGLCSNCHEEAYIFENQYEDLPDRLSDEFSDKVKEQLKNRKLRSANT